MASNPIKRRARQSFFLGFLIALVVMAVVVMLLFTRINKLNEENAKLVELNTKGANITVYTVNRDIEVGDAITADDLRPASMKLVKDSTPIGVADYVDPSIFSAVDDDGNAVDVTYTARVKILEGTVATLSMLQQGGLDNDERMMEYNMIVLPTQLAEEDYIDIRLRLANGTETIVIPKKKVEQCTATSIWIKMTEIEILTLNSAIVDAYLVEGSQLRATIYTNPLMQDASEQNYPVNRDVLDAITYNPNILVEARNALISKWNVTSDANSGLTDFVARRRTIDSYVPSDQEDRAEKVAEAVDKETENLAASRDEYISNLEGTGMAY